MSPRSLPETWTTTVAAAKAIAKKRPMECDWLATHCEWKDVLVTKNEPGGSKAYKDRDLICTETEYGVKFASSLCFDNVFASQFHPEKSSKAGFKVLKNFIEGPSC